MTKDDKNRKNMKQMRSDNESQKALELKVFVFSQNSDKIDSRVGNVIFPSCVPSPKSQHAKLVIP